MNRISQQKMISVVKPLHSLLMHCYSYEDRIEAYKMSVKAVRELFGCLDYRRRGYLDVADLFHKLPDLSEDELFFVFKTLDVSRTGTITLDDLIQTLSLPTADRSWDMDYEKCFNSYIRILKSALHSIETEKRKLNLQPNILSLIFQRITQHTYKDSLSGRELLNLFKENGLEVTEKLCYFVENKVFKGSCLNMKEFVQIFSPISENVEQKTVEKQKNTEKINSDIDRILQKYERLPHQQPQFTRDHQVHQDFYNKTSPKLNPADRSWENIRKTHDHTQDRDYNKFVHQQQKLEQSPKIDELLRNSFLDRGNDDILKRREELRKGSVERQRIIDEMVIRKHRIENQDRSHLRFDQFKLREALANKNEDLLYKTYSPMNLQSALPSQTPLENYQSYNKFNSGKSYLTDYLKRPASATKVESTLFSNFPKNYTSSKPDLKIYYRRNCETPKNAGYEKENILRRAEEEATKKIEEIERKARLKVMEKRSATGMKNCWLK